MILHPIVTVQPTTEPLTVAEALERLKLNSGDESVDKIARLIVRARRVCENYCGLSFLTQTRQINLDTFPCGTLIVPYGPVQSVEEFTYVKSDGTTGTLVEGTDFRVSSNAGVTRIQSISGWPTPKDQVDAVTLSYIAGFLNTPNDPLPEEAIEMCEKVIARLYEKRGDEDSGMVLTDEIMELGDSIKVFWNAHV